LASELIFVGETLIGEPVGVVETESGALCRALAMLRAGDNSPTPEETRQHPAVASATKKRNGSADVMKSSPITAPVDLNDEISRRKWLQRLASQARAGAIKRGIGFDLSPDYGEILFQTQDGRCAVTGIPFHMQRFPDAFVKYPFAPSIDRILSSGAYTSENTRLVCAAVNFGMGQWGEELFLTLARYAVAYDKAKSASDEKYWYFRQDERIAAAETILLILPVEERRAQAHHIAGLKASRSKGPDGLREGAIKARKQPRSSAMTANDEVQ